MPPDATWRPPTFEHLEALVLRRELVLREVLDHASRRRALRAASSRRHQRLAPRQELYTRSNGDGVSPPPSYYCPRQLDNSRKNCSGNVQIVNSL